MLEGRWLAIPYALSGSAAPAVPDAHPGAAVLLGVGADEGFQLRVLTVEAGAMQAKESIDGSLLGSFDMQAARLAAAPLLAAGARAKADFAQALDIMRLGYAAYLVGLMDEALRIAVGYMKLRKQFGMPIGSLQVLQNRAATCHVDIVATCALIYEACLEHAGGSPRAWATRRKACCAISRGADQSTFGRPGIPIASFNSLKTQKI
ncbi:MAG: acyl-CoA/acyl-ACP dehydrogenase [Candidatus Protistobacter heckmanni]|nr:acyl-CoA/acyl-ACP dehydrogenase [Candidatus Protistobacter heckmanni]